MSSSSPSLYSFVTKDRQSLELLETPQKEEESQDTITFEILETSLTANNKFYLAFGNKAPFYFDKCYPVNQDESTLVVVGDTEQQQQQLDKYIHPPVWGICKVVKSNTDDIPAVGTLYTAMLPIASHVSFAKAHVTDEGNLIVDRPTTNPAYNEFRKLQNDDTDRDMQTMKLVCGPGYLTGFGLYFALEEKEWYGCDTLVLTSASSKVSLSLAFYIKEAGKSNHSVSVVGYTSDSNRAFCESTGLYDSILGYEEEMPNDVLSCVMVDVAGNSKPFLKNRSKITKLLAVGNASAAEDSESTFGCFSTSGSMKLVLTMMGAPMWTRSWMNPTEELFMIVDTMKILQAKWGHEKLEEVKEEHANSFCKAALQWMNIRRCETEESIAEAFQDIVTGKVGPAEAICLDAAKATKHRASL